MDPELKILFEEQLKISRESLDILKQLNRARKIGRFFTIAKWIVIVALLILGFITIQPYLDSVTNTATNASEALRQLNEYYFPQQQ